MQRRFRHRPQTHSSSAEEVVDQRMDKLRVSIVKIMTKSRKLTLFLAAFVFFAYGTIVGHYQVFPFQFLNQGVQYVKNTIRKSENFVQVSFVKSKLKNSSKFDWADQFLVERLQFSESGELNNFQVLRTSIENFGNEKLAYLNFSNGLLIAYAHAMGRAHGMGRGIGIGIGIGMGIGIGNQ